MLTKLNENGQQLCHRYWPEEGSEQYHIFEVHLVSEHVWCDDYLVRSVYLKNTRTGETRTVNLNLNSNTMQKITYDFLT